MESKFEFDKLYDDCKKRVGYHSDDTTLIRLARTSTSNFELFKPSIEERLIFRLLNHVVRSDYKAVEEMLKKNENLIHGHSAIIDPAGRYFNDISPIKYIIWARNRLMCEIVLQTISPTNKEVWEKLILQYSDISKIGCTYTSALSKEKTTERYFNFGSALEQLQIQINLKKSLKAPGLDENSRKEKQKEADTQWATGYGGEQKKFPRHLALSFCIPKSNVQHTEFYNHLTKRYEDWYSSESLGITTALLMPRTSEEYGTHHAQAFSSAPNNPSLIQNNFDVLKNYQLSTIEYFNTLKSQLEEKREHSSQLKK